MFFGKERFDPPCSIDKKFLDKQMEVLRKSGTIFVKFADSVCNTKARLHYNTIYAIIEQLVFKNGGRSS